MLILDGKPVTSVVGGERVRDRIVFKPPMPGCRKQTRPWRGLGLHWTGGEGGVERVIATLLARDLSVPFVIEPRGEINQLADLRTRCAHIAAPGNDVRIGCEVVCRGFATKADLEQARLLDSTLRARDELDWATPRDTYQDRIGNHTIHFAGYNAEQLDAVVWLSETLAALFRFPRLIPARTITLEDFAKIADALPLANPGALLVKVGGQYWIPDFSRDVRKGPGGRAAKFEGAIGHFMTHRNKCDPGTQPLYALWSAGWNPAGVVVPCVVSADPFCVAT